MKGLVLCGGMPQIALLQELKRRNINTVLVDFNPTAPAVPFADKFYAVSALDVDGVRKVAVDEMVDFLLTACADQIPLVVAQISEELGLPTYISYKTAQEVSSKVLMKEIFVKNSIPTSKYTVRETISENDLQGMIYPLIVKPVDSYSSRGVKKCNSYLEVRRAFSEAIEISRTDTAIVEEYVGGEELTVDVYVEEGVAKILSIGALDKIQGNNKFVICRGRYPSDISDETRKEIAVIAQKIAEAFYLKDTPMLIQLKVDGNRISVIEFCARTGGGIKYKLIKDITGFDVIKAMLDLTLGMKPHVEDFDDSRKVINEFLYCKQGTLDHLEGLEESKKEGIIDDFAQFRGKGYTFGDEVKSSGDRVAYFSIYAKDDNELYERYEKVKERLRALDEKGNDLLHHEYLINKVNYE